MRIVLIFFLLFFYFEVAAQTVLTADGPGNTYELITSVLAPGQDPIEVPDCSHSGFGRHIDEVFDADLNTNVFRFLLHVAPDNDRCINFDRQRNEIKTYNQSPPHLLGVQGEIVEYKWKFKLPAGFQSSPNFTHIHQLKAVGGTEDAMPLITLTTRKNTPDQLELRYAQTTTQVTLTQTNLAPFLDEWVEVTELVTYGEIGTGTYSIVINKISDNSTLFSYSNNNIRMWKTAASFVRPKWGIYRSLLSSSDLQDEEVLYNDFSIQELTGLPTTIFLEDFDGSNTTNPLTFSEYVCSDDKDYFNIVCQNGAGCTNEISSDFVINNASGQYFGVRDMDATPCSNTLTKSFDISSINISACTSEVLYLCFDVAESRNMGGALGDEWSVTNAREDTWDSGSSLKITASIDGSSFENVTAVEALDNSDTRPGIDANCDGKADDAGEPLLTDTFTKYCFELPTAGLALDLNFEFNEFNTQGEDIAVDNIGVYCGLANLPTSGTQLNACTPFVTPTNQLTSFFLEDFDGANTTNLPTFSEICSDDRDYFDVVCQSGVGCANEINSIFTLNNLTGQYFGVRDMDASPCLTTNPKTMDFAGIDISSCTSDVLYICIDFAESRNMGGALGDEWSISNAREDTWDSGSSCIITASIDGSSFTTVTAIEASDNSDTRPGIDVNCDGKADDAGEPLLTDTFTKYCFELPSASLVLDLNFEFTDLNTQGEDLALDNIELFCGAANLPTAANILAACTPFTNPSTAFFFEDFDGANTTNIPTFSEMCNDDRDYFDIVCQNGAGCANEINDDFTINNAVGQYFGVRDFDSAPCSTDTLKTMDIDAIDIASCNNNLYLCFDVAESRNFGDALGNEWSASNAREDTWDGNSSFKVTVNIDGSSYLVTAIEAYDNSDTRPGIDANCDGKADDLGEPALTDTFTKYCFQLPTTGSNLNIHFDFLHMNTGGEDFALDNIGLYCDAANLPFSGTLLNACNTPIASNCQNTLFVSGIIATGIYEAIIDVQSNGTINATQNVTMNAGSFVELQTGFDCNANADLHVYILPCQ